YIPAIIAENSKNKISHIGLNSVLRGEEALQKSLEKHIEQNNRIIVVDAVTEENIEVIAEAMASIEMNKSSSSLVVPVDRGPLTAIYASALSHRTTEIRTQDALDNRITNGLAKITRLVMNETSYAIQGCFTSGGDVTASLVAETEASGIRLEEEVMPLTAYGTMIGGHFPDLPMVTK